MKSQSDFIKEVEEFIDKLNVGIGSDKAFIIIAAHTVEGETQAMSAITGEENLISLLLRNLLGKDAIRSAMARSTMLELASKLCNEDKDDKEDAENEINEILSILKNKN